MQLIQCLLQALCQLLFPTESLCQQERFKNVPTSQLLAPSSCTAAHASHLVAHAGMSGPPPAEVVEGLRNPQLDKFVPPRRKEASEKYSAYKPLTPQYVHLPIVDLQVRNS